MIPRPDGWPAREPADVAREHADLDVYSQVEGLASEEDRLLEAAEKGHRARRWPISRAWQRLRERAQRRRRPG